MGHFGNCIRFGLCNSFLGRQLCVSRPVAVHQWRAHDDQVDATMQVLLRWHMAPPQTTVILWNNIVQIRPLILLAGSTDVVSTAGDSWNFYLNTLTVGTWAAEVPNSSICHLDNGRENYLRPSPARSLLIPSTTPSERTYLLLRQQWHISAR